jgi:chloramphenicol-sensitive protein RarD
MTDALRAGYIYGFIAYGLWGLIPIYFRMLTGYADAYEILGQRIVWSAVMLIVVLGVLRRWRELYEAVRRPRGCLALLASSALIGANWFVYIYGVQTQRVVYCSLGYFITPLVSVALGVFLLGEKVRAWQLVALGCGVVGMVILASGADEFPWIALSLAATFSTYGLIRKLAAAEALVGLAAETFFLTPLALWYVVTHGSVWQTADVTGQWLFVVSGPATVIPLYCFARAAKLLPLSILGFLQYISPSLQFLVAVTIFGEPLDALRLVAFGVVWLGLGIFTWDALQNRGKAMPVEAVVPPE